MKNRPLCSLLSSTIGRALLAFTLVWFASHTAGVAAPVDVVSLRASGAVHASTSPLDIGGIASIFDGSTDSLARSAAVNPLSVTLVFASPLKLAATGVWFLAGDNRWRIETADSLADLDTRTGSFRVALDWITASESTWSDRSLPVPMSCKVVRLHLQRLTGDDYVHLSEWRLEVADEPLSVTRVTRQPEGFELVWSSRPGSWYELQSSTDMAHWTGGTFQKSISHSTGITLPPQSQAAMFHRIREAKPEDRPYLVKKLLVVDVDPVLENRGGQRLTAVMGWNDPATLHAAYMADLTAASGNFVRWEVAQWVHVDHWPRKLDGFAYDDESYLAAWASGHFHSPDAMDYDALIDLPLASLNGKSIHQAMVEGLADEVVCWAFPYSGMFESRMIGRGAYFCNSPGLERDSPLYVLMGLNPERGVAEALHSFGHRAESILARVFGSWSSGAAVNHLWDRFTRIGPVHGVGVAGCGNVHFPPNAAADYAYDTATPVTSEADRWLNYPDLTGPVAPVSADTWGGPDHHRNFLKWWFAHFPRTAGRRVDPANAIDHGKLNNWWNYVVDMNEHAESR